jgi:hypothetical protein
MAAPVFPWAGRDGRAEPPWSLPEGEGRPHEVLVDGTPWTDSGGATSWELGEAEALAGALEALGYCVEIVSA